MRKSRFLIAVAAILPSMLNAQGVVYSAPIDTPTVQALIDSAMLTVPQPGSAVPSEIVGGTAGTATATFMRSDAKPARISRSTTVTTITGGTFSGTWATALLSAPTLILTPIAPGGTAVTCELTAAPTTTTFAGRCWTAQSTLLNLSIVTTGLTVSPSTASAAGISVQVIAIPPTQ